jgi:hypothetical protein
MGNRFLMIAVLCVVLGTVAAQRASGQDGWNTNWAFNLNPGTPDAPIAPRPFESDHGWGGGAQTQENVDGFRGCNAPGGWPCGLAFTGGDSD